MPAYNIVPDTNTHAIKLLNQKELAIYEEQAKKIIADYNKWLDEACEDLYWRFIDHHNDIPSEISENFHELQDYLNRMDRRLSAHTFFEHVFTPNEVRIYTKLITELVPQIKLIDNCVNNALSNV